MKKKGIGEKKKHQKNKIKIEKRCANFFLFSKKDLPGGQPRGTYTPPVTTRH